MLKLFSRMERTQKSIIIGFAFLMAASLVLFYAPGRNNTALADPTRSTETLAKVGGERITLGELATEKKGMQARFGGQFSLAQIGFTDKRLLDQLIKSRVISQEAARLGLAASDGEVADAIRKQFKDPATDQFVGIDRYKEIVTANYGDIERFERQMRDQIAAQKLEAFVTAGVTVADEEVQDDYKRKFTTYGLVYVPVTAAKLAGKVQPSDEELRAYYEQHKTDYRYLEPQKKVRYLFIDQAKMGEKLSIPDEDLRKEYEQLSEENKQAGVKVQQILLKVARPDLDKQVEEKAKGLVERYRANPSEQLFADLAKGNSEDPSTAKNGGFLPNPVKKNPNKINALYDRTVDMQVGEITDAVRYGGNWYILRRGDSVPKTFEQAKPELLVSMRNRRAYGVAAQLAEKAASRLKETKDVQKVAQEFAGQANMTATDMVRETPYVKPGDDVPKIGVNQQFEDALAPLNNPNDVGERTPVTGGFAIPLLVDKKEPRIPEFDEVKERVLQAVRLERAATQVEQTARELAQAASPEALKAQAEKMGLEVKTEDGYKLGSPLGEAGTSPSADDAIYALRTGEVTKSPVKIGENWVVLGMSKRYEVDLADFAKQRDQLTQQAVSERRNIVFSDYIDAVQARMQREGKIEIYEKVLAQLAESEEPPAALPRRAPILPGQK
ncbi:MAG TPA: peptidyl-prolyl cis-trans isomerase [Pyrinomonadaceae bacterium]|jgi:peptidyl-prolyl cis-trans isomerase D